MISPPQKYGAIKNKRQWKKLQRKKLQMKIEYAGTQRIAPMKEIFSSIFSVHYFEGDETPRCLSIILFNREWYWNIGEAR